MQRDPSLIQFNDLSSLSQKKFERARSKYLLDKLTGKLNNADYFLQLTRSMAELNGTDTDEFLQSLYAKAKQQKEAQAEDGRSQYSRNLAQNPSQATLTAKAKDQAGGSDFAINPEPVESALGVAKAPIQDEPHKASAAELARQKKAWSELDKYIELLLDSK